MIFLQFFDKFIPWFGAALMQDYAIILLAYYIFTVLRLILGRRKLVNP